MLEQRIRALERAVTLVESAEKSSDPSSSSMDDSSGDPDCLTCPDLVLSPGDPYPCTDKRIPELEAWNQDEELTPSLRSKL